MATEEQTLEQRLEALLDQEKFDPPAEFCKQAEITDAQIFQKAEDYEGFWGEQAEALHWAEKWDTVLDQSDPPFFKWGSPAGRSTSPMCRSPRRGGQRRPRRVPLARRGGRGARHHVRGPASRRP